MAMPCAQDRSCFEERSCQSGLGLLSACGVGGWEGCAFPQLHSRPPDWDPGARPAAGAPSTPGPQQSGQYLWGMTGACSLLVLAHRVGWARAGPRALRPGSGGRAVVAPPHWHRRASPGAPSFMRRSLLCDRRLLMLNALIRRDKTTLKIPRCRPPVGARGLPGGRRPGQGGCWEVPKLFVL